MNTVTLTVQLTFDTPVDAADYALITEKVGESLDTLYDESFPNLTLVSGIKTTVLTEGYP